MKQQQNSNSGKTGASPDNRAKKQTKKDIKEQVLNDKAHAEAEEEATLQEATGAGEKVDKQPGGGNNVFAPGAFDAPKRADNKNPVKIEEGAETNAKEETEPLTITEAIDAIMSFIGILFFFDNDEENELALTQKETEYYVKLEKRCGLELFINSPAFYFAMLGICYARKIAITIKAKRMAKKLALEAEKQAEEEKKKEQRDNLRNLTEEPKKKDGKPTKKATNKKAA